MIREFDSMEEGLGNVERKDLKKELSNLTLNPNPNAVTRQEASR